MKTHNEYSKVISADVYEKMPKTVLAAIAVSFASRIQSCSPEAAAVFLLKEWKTLHANGIIPQKPLA
jgi:hypothetical protein